MTDFDRLMKYAGAFGAVAFQLRELIAIIETSDSLDEIRAQAAVARRQLNRVENNECK